MEHGRRPRADEPGRALSKPSRRRGGSTTRPTAKRTTSQRVEPRTAKNSTFRESRSKRGWATASAESPARWSAAVRNEPGGSGGRSRTVENPRAGGEDLAALDAPALRERALESLGLVIGVRALGPCGPAAAAPSGRPASETRRRPPCPGRRASPERHGQGRCRRATRGGQGQGTALARAVRGRRAAGAPHRASRGPATGRRRFRPVGGSSPSLRREATGRGSRRPPRPRPLRPCSRPRPQRSACSGRRCSRDPTGAAGAGCPRPLGRRPPWPQRPPRRRDSPSRNRTRQCARAPTGAAPPASGACGRWRGSARRETPPSSSRVLTSRSA